MSDENAGKAIDDLVNAIFGGIAPDDTASVALTDCLDDKVRENTVDPAEFGCQELSITRLQDDDGNNIKTFGSMGAQGIHAFSEFTKHGQFFSIHCFLPWSAAGKEPPLHNPTHALSSMVAERMTLSVLNYRRKAGITDPPIFEMSHEEFERLREQKEDG